MSLLDTLSGKASVREQPSVSLADTLAGKRPRRTRRQESLADLQQEAGLLQAEVDEFGAPGIEQEKPGVFRTVIDLLSRPNYAIAGFAEEILGGERSITRGLTRAMGEIFSGVGGIQGEKRAFGEVFENLGAGTTTLADVFPALEDTWVGNFGSRGAAGLAADIFLDPLTYMTFGTGTGLKIAAGKGGKTFLNRAGRDKFQEMFRKNLAEARGTDLGKLGDEIAESRLFDRTIIKTENEFVEQFGTAGQVAQEFLEPGGAKLFGKTLPGTDRIGGAIGRSLNMLPESVVKPVVDGATTMRAGMARTLNGLFSPEGALANLPEPIRTRAVRLTNSFFRSSTAHRTRMMNEIEPLRAIYRKLEKSDPKIGERWHDIREGLVSKNTISGDELDAYEATMALYDSMGRTLVDHGILTDEQLLRGYIYHQYKNLEDLAQYHAMPGMTPSGPRANITKERAFESTRLAEDISKQQHDLGLHLLSRGELKNKGLYPILQPEFDVFANMEKYIGQHADVVARQAWREEMAQQFGKSLDELVDPDALYQLPKGLKEVPPTPGDVPFQRVIPKDAIETTLEKAFGRDGARYVAVKSVLTGNETAFLPKAIADSLESVNSKLFNTREYAEFGKLLKGFDWLNNNFKWGVYTIWPASLTRDGYSNLFLGGLRIGANAINPARHRDAILLMAGRSLSKEFAGSGYTLGQLRDMSKTFGVWVPGQVFIEQTGRFHVGKFRKALTEKRAGIENEARILLWLDEIRHGVDPRSAADTVGQFLFNYGEVSRAERDVFRRLIPFYTFTRKNVELQAKMLRQNPGRVINQAKPFRGRDSENESMVQWEAEALKLRMDRDGKTVHMLTGIDLPIRNIDTLWRGDFGRTGRSLVGMVTPVVKTIPELLLNQDFFLGRDMTRTQSGAVGKFMDVVPTPQALKDWMGYRKTVDEAGRPSYTFDGRRFTLVFRSWMFSRAISTSDRQFRDNINGGGVQWQRIMLDTLTGIRRKDIDLDEQMRRRLNNRIRQLEESLARRGRRATFRKRFTPKDLGEFQ